ncbi:HEAT repeat domain-containing protein [Phyllobacterium sp. A18/5-2]|jgi:HEAT repeat protein|uniref:HEAT repeat domain-containing protein n=1 Tax=Phyllobacterium sp. A18/5-2 TaxID=2978392 RepID=UPI000DDC29B6|nr:HEAT repeat domain-containing protein [Phyllobacterium sp. A18/5-2]UXN63707.1 HEAT repeat domain-containing protein [Phyllobacterium sp. A18/5-2]
MLYGLWIISLLLAAISLLVMTGLVAARMFRANRQERRELARKRLLPAFLAFTEDGDQEAFLSKAATVPMSTTVDLSLEFLNLMRGDEHANLVNVLTRAGVARELVFRTARGNRTSRIHAVEALPFFPGPETTVSLRNALKDRSADVRLSAAIGLVAGGSNVPLAELLEQLGTGDLASRRLVGLFRHLPAERLDELREILKSGETPSIVRAAAIEALGTSGDYSLLPLFAACIADGEPEVSAAAIHAIGELAHPAGATAIERALTNADWQVRAEAATAVARIGLDRASGQLSELLEDDQWLVRYAASKALFDLGADGRTVLVDIAKGGRPRSQRAAALLLAEEGYEAQ